MAKQELRSVRAAVGRAIRGTVGLLALLAAPLALQTLQAQSVTLFGALSNFDVLNDTGQDTHGFEIELQGISTVPYSFPATRYGASKSSVIPGGVVLRWSSPWDAANQRFTVNDRPRLITAEPRTLPVERSRPR